MNSITNDIRYIGVNDHVLDLFEGQYDVPNGMAYNSYVILDEKVAVFDSVDARFGQEWLGELAAALDGRKPDYLIIQHMEPDHSANIALFVQTYPDAVLVGNAKTFGLLGQFYPDLTVPAEKMRTVKDGETLSLGRHELRFVFAPMVHWPEVMFTYDSTDKVLFSADAFGKFGALDVEEDWACEARRYYFGIVGKYGQQVQAVLKKAAALDIQTICPLHGPVLTEDLGYYLGLYQTWSSYGAESEGICIAYTSVYGHTKEAVEQLAAMLTEKGCPKVAVTDLARDDMAEAVEDAFRYGTLVLASTTYNNDVFPFMRTFIEWLTERNYQNKRIGIIENGSWAPTAGKTMKGLFEKSKNITFTDTTVTIKSALNDTSRAALAALADELMA
ncbi:MAG: FprA family A-type flavoprotein [Oscillospiraceae bacterium]|nr:FprA family A-type flavoprotein [Oscillospiraceae bacterium]